MKKLLALVLVAAMLLSLASLSLAAEELVLRRHYTTPHGERGFARVVVAMVGDKIVGVALDEFQYVAPGEGVTPVPNTEALAASVKENNVLISKRVSSASYSKNMAEKAGSTVAIDANYDAVQAFCVGKTVADLEAVIAAAEPGKPIDAVTGATLADTAGYLNAIVETAKSDAFIVKGSVEDATKVVLKQGQGAPHGTKAFGDVVVALENDKIVAVSMDEFQYFAGTGVPNSDKAFGGAYADATKPLASKLVNAEAYSKNMVEKAQSTVSIDANYAAIEAFCVGKTAAELKEFAGKQEAGKPVDAVTGATLADTVGYLNMIADVAAL